MKYFVTYFKSHLFLNDKKFKLDVHNNLTYTSLHKSECKISSNKFFNSRGWHMESKCSRGIKTYQFGLLILKNIQGLKCTTLFFFLISKLFRSLQALRGGQNLFPYLITSVFTYYSSYLPSQWSFAPGPFSQKSLQKLGSMFQVYVIIQKKGKESVKKAHTHTYPLNIWSWSSL